MKKIFKKYQFIAGLLSIVVAMFLVVLATYAATTISTNISTGGTLTVTGVSTLGSAASTSGDFWLGNGASDDDDFLYMDASGSEYLMWDNEPGRFQLTDDLLISGNVTTTGTLLVGSSSYDETTSTVGIVGNLHVTEKATSSTSLWVGANASPLTVDFVGGDLFVVGDAEFLATVTTTTAINTQGTMRVGSTITADGNITSNAIVTSTDALNTQGTLHVGSNATIQGWASTTTSLNTQGTLHVGGLASATGEYLYMQYLKFEPIATPSPAVAGKCFVDSGDNQLNCYDGSAWQQAW